MGLNDTLVARIVAKGQPLKLSLGVQVLSFSYEDTEKEDDMFNVLFADPYNKLVDSEQFVENTEWTVQWGFPGFLLPSRKVHVKRPRFRFGEVEVEALDKGSGLKLEENWDAVGPTSLVDVIEKIAKKHKLTPVVSEITRSMPFFLQGGLTDFEVLQYLQSRLEDHIFKIVDDKLHFFKRRMNIAPLATFEYAPGRDSRLISFEIAVKEQENAKSSKQTTALSIDPFTFKKNLYKSDETNTPTDNLGNRRVTDKLVTSFSSTVDAVTSKFTGGKASNQAQSNSTGKSIILPPKSTEELESIAKGKRRKALLDSVEATFEIMASPNDPYLKSGSIIEVQGIGKKFSGTYRIIKITHDLSNGYVYKIDAKRNAVGSTASSTPPVLNGPSNIKKALAKTAQVVETIVRGSNSLDAYGQAGRRITGI